MADPALRFLHCRPRRGLLALLLLPLAALATGCVEREIWIVTDPPGVTVQLDGEEMDGVTEPLVDDAAESDIMRAAAGRQLGVLKIPFDRYATREVVLRKDGYETQTHHISPDQPLWEHFPFDFVTEVLLPSTIDLRFVFRFTMEESNPARDDQTISDRTMEDANRVRLEAGGKLRDAQARAGIDDGAGRNR